MKNNRILTVSIGTSAFNEENNIRNMLESVINQKENNISIIEIIVVSDGSTDNTTRYAKSLKDKRIIVLDDKKRLGQPSRIAQLLKIFRGDVLVLIDSDMVLKDKTTIEKLVSKFRTNKNTALVCGETFPLPAQTFLESAINNYRYARSDLENKGIYNFGNTAYCAHAFFAVSKKFGNSIKIPEDILNTDAFCYFSCIYQGYRQYYEKGAIALYRSPQIVKDHINQSVRHLKGGIQLYGYFGKKLVDRKFYVPKPIMARLLSYQLKKNPIGYIFLKVLNIYCGFKSKRISGNFDIRWSYIRSSKMPIL